MAGSPGPGALQALGQQTQAAIDSAKKAGFSGLSLVTIVAIARAESGLDPTARNTNTDGSIDRGILQFNNRFHPEVSDTCADNPDCAFQAAYRVSQQGTNFNQWSTFKEGKQWAYVSSIGNMAGVAIPANWKQNETNAQNNNIPGVQGVTQLVQSVTDPLTALGNAFQTLTSPATWVRVGLFGVALVFLIIGFMIVATGMGKKTAEPVTV